MVKRAMNGGAGLLVSDLFQEDRLAHAPKWMQGMYDRVPDNLTLSSRVFTTPRFLNVAEDVEGGGEGVEGGDSEQPSCEDPGEVEMRETGDRYAELVTVLEMCTDAKSVVGQVQDLFGRRKSVRLATPPQGTESYLTCAVKYDEKLVWKTLSMVLDRRISLGYRKDLEERLRTQQKPLRSRGEERRSGHEEQDEETPLVFSAKPHIDNLAESLEAEGKMSPEIKDLQELGFFKMRCMSFWYVCMLEELALMPERDFHMLFLKAVDGSEDPTWDDKRKINVGQKDDFLFELVCGPIKKMLELLALAGRKEVGVCALLKSLERSLLKAILQGHHADMCPSFDWESDFGLSCITAGSKPAQLDIYVGSFDGGMGSKGTPVRVDLLPGETIVLNGLARHRGVSYSSLNL
ncbi:unnamed protein product [Pylaiella littoralis]